MMPLYNSMKDLIHQSQTLFVPQAFKLKEIKSSHSCKLTNRTSALQGVGDKGSKTKFFPRQISLGGELTWNQYPVPSLV